MYVHIYRERGGGDKINDWGAEKLNVTQTLVLYHRPRQESLRHVVRFTLSKVPHSLDYR